jgi:hypothetical protein
MPSPSFTVWRPPLCERHRSEAIAGRLVTSAAAYPSMSIIGPFVKCFDPDQERTLGALRQANRARSTKLFPQQRVRQAMAEEGRAVTDNLLRVAFDSLGYSGNSRASSKRNCQPPAC